MKALHGTSPPGRELRAEAAAWLAKLHGPERSDALEADFRSWLGSSRENARAFEHMTDIWDSLGAVNIGGLARPDLHAGGRQAGRSGDRRFGPVVRWGSAAAACALAAFAYLQLGAGDRYVTDIGEQRIVTLADGTRLSLNSATRLNVEFSDTARHIELDRGEAYFEVAKDARRPFVVSAGSRTVTALGTAFAVRYERNLTTITLVEGKVSVDAIPAVPSAAVTENSKAVAAPTVLIPGQRLTYAGARPPRLDVSRSGTAIAWRRGEVILDNTPLGEAVEEMNRYERQRLVLDGSIVADLPVSGIYRTGDSAGFARAVASVYGLDVEVLRNEIHLRRR